VVKLRTTNDVGNRTLFGAPGTWSTKHLRGSAFVDRQVFFLNELYQ